VPYKSSLISIFPLPDFDVFVAKIKSYFIFFPNISKPFFISFDDGIKIFYFFSSSSFFTTSSVKTVDDIIVV